MRDVAALFVRPRHEWRGWEYLRLLAMVSGIGGWRGYPKTISRFGASRGFQWFSERLLVIVA
jgi:hypothetical protein